MASENANLFGLNFQPQSNIKNIKKVTKKSENSIVKKYPKKEDNSLSFLKSKNKSKVFKGIYFEEDVWNYIQTKTKETGMSNSEIINKMIIFIKTKDK